MVTLESIDERLARIEDLIESIAKPEIRLALARQRGDTGRIRPQVDRMRTFLDERCRQEHGAMIVASEFLDQYSRFAGRKIHHRQVAADLLACGILRDRAYIDHIRQRVVFGIAWK